MHSEEGFLFFLYISSLPGRRRELLSLFRQDIYVLRQDGSIYCEISVGDYISNMFAMKDGKIVAAYRGNTGYSLDVVDPVQKDLKPLDTSIVFDYGTFTCGTDTDLLYTQNSVLYACNLSDEKPVSLLNWIDSDINSNYLRDFTILEDGRIAAVTVDFSSGAETELSILTKRTVPRCRKRKRWFIPPGMCRIMRRRTLWLLISAATGTGSK